MQTFIVLSLMVIIPLFIIFRFGWYQHNIIDYVDREQEENKKYVAPKKVNSNFTNAQEVKKFNEWMNHIHKSLHEIQRN